MIMIMIIMTMTLFEDPGVKFMFFFGILISNPSNKVGMTPSLSHCPYQSFWGETHKRKENTRRSSVRYIYPSILQ